MTCFHRICCFFCFFALLCILLPSAALDPTLFFLHRGGFVFRFFCFVSLRKPRPCRHWRIVTGTIGCREFTGIFFLSSSTIPSATGPNTYNGGESVDQVWACASGSPSFSRSFVCAPSCAPWLRASNLRTTHIAPPSLYTPLPHSPTRSYDRETPNGRKPC